MRLVIGCDEAAYQLKKTIMDHLSDIGVEYEDYGAAEGEYRRTAFSDSYSGRKHFPDSSYDWKDIYVDRP